MYLPVHRDSCQGETAGIHGEVDEKVHCLAGKGTKEPPIQRVDGGLEGDTEDNEAQVRHRQVKDEQVGGVVFHLSIAQQHSQHQAVPYCAHKEDEGEDHRHNNACSSCFYAV